MNEDLETYVIFVCLQLMLSRVNAKDMQQTAEELENPQSNEPEKVPFVVVPLIHELTTNVTQLAEKRAMGQRKIKLVIMQYYHHILYY